MMKTVQDKSNPMKYHVIGISKRILKTGTKSECNWYKNKFKNNR